MARVKRKAPQKRTRKTQEVEPTLAQQVAGRKTALLFGTVTLITAAVLASGYFVNRNVINKEPVSPTPTVIPVTTEIPLTPEPSGTVSATPSAEKTGVKKLPATTSEPISYTVRAGDTLSSVASDFCDNEDSWIQIARQNNLSEPYSLEKGTTLLVSCL